MCIMYACVHSGEGQRTTSACLSLSTLFETGVFVVYHSVSGQWALQCLEILLCLPPLSHRTALRLQTHPPMSSFHIGLGELGLHPQACGPTPKSLLLCSHKHRGMLVRIVIDKGPHRPSLVSLKSFITIVMAKVNLSIYRLQILTYETVVC